MAADNERYAEVLRAQESELVYRVESVRATGKGELIGAEFEGAIREKLADVLPSTIRVTSGFIMMPEGGLSTHFDGILIDARYPYLCRAGVVDIVPIHAVIGVFELKVSLAGDELNDAMKKEKEIYSLFRKFNSYLKKDKCRKIEGLIEQAKNEPRKSPMIRLQIQEIKKTSENFYRPIFAVLAHESDFSVAAASEKLYDNRSDAHLIILRPKQEKYKKKPSKNIRMTKLGAKGPAYHIWREYSRGSKPGIAVRGTSYAYGFFLSQTLIQEAMSVLATRDFGLKEISSHLDPYIEKLIDISKEI